MVGFVPADKHASTSTKQLQQILLVHIRSPLYAGCAGSSHVKGITRRKRHHPRIPQALLPDQIQKQIQTSIKQVCGLHT